MKKFSLFVAAVVSAWATVAHAQDGLAIAFPVTRDGDHVLAVDTHVHSVFSERQVLPGTRVSEANADGLRTGTCPSSLRNRPPSRATASCWSSTASKRTSGSMARA